MFSGITNFLQPYLLAIVGILIITFGAYFGYSQWRIDGLVKDNLSKDITLQAQENALKQAGIDIEKIKEINKEITEENESNREAEDLLEERIKNIGEIAKENPELVEQRINDASQKRIRCFELATGAKPRKDEINSECQHLIK